MSTVEITVESFTSIVKKPGIVVIDWWASWCGPCRAFAPVFEKAAERHPDVVWGKIETDAQPELSSAFAIRSIPTLMIFRDGVLLFSQPGVLPAAALDELLAKVRVLDMAEVLRKSQDAAKPGAGAAASR